MATIWETLPRPSFILAPLDDVTDTVFRQVVARMGAPDLFFTEFVDVEGLGTRGRHAIARRLGHTAVERPLIAQIWGLTPEKFYAAARQIAAGEHGPFVGIDLNMGCPERKIVRRGACAGLIDRPERAVEIIQATKAGAGDLPVSVKTRCGVSRWMTEEWAEILLRQELAALTIHGRIAKEMSFFPARWEEIARVVALRDRLGVATRVIGNGDVTSYQDGLAKARTYGVDGVMIGRGIFANLWFFDPAVDPASISLRERLELLVWHIHLWQATWQGRRDFGSLKKFYKCYLGGVPEAAELQHALLRLETVADTLARVEAALAALAAAGAGRSAAPVARGQPHSSVA
jgi:tRNA-dihydrouridine synthase